MAFVGGAAALGELGLGIAGAVGGAPASNVPLPSPLPGTGQAGSNFMSTTGGLGQYNLYDPNSFSSLSYGILNNPYSSQYQNAAGPAGAMGMAGGANMFGAGNNLYGAGTNIMDLALDPQGALYNRTVQQLQDQTRTANAAAGVSSTPYGAGVEGNVMSNFNIDWQNNQLMRALQGAQGAGQAYQGAAGLQSQAPVQYMYGGGLPYGTFNNINNTGLGALSNLQSYGQAGANIPTSQAQLYSQYALGGQGVNNQTGQLGLNQANLGFNQNSMIGQSIGYGLGGLSNTGWGMGGYSPYQMAAYNPSTMGPMLPGGYVNP